MTRLTRGDRLIFAGLLVLLFGVAVLSFYSESARSGDIELQGSTLSPAAGGTLALYRWFEDSGYPVRRVTGGDRWADSLRETDVLFVLNPQSNFAPGQLAALDNWMAAGGVLVISLEGSTGLTNPVAAHLDVSLSPLLPPVSGALVPREPVWTAPPVRQVAVQASWSADLQGDDGVPLLNAGGSPLILAQPRGKGRLVLLSTTYPFTNAGLPQAENRWLAWNLAGGGLGRRIAFDEVHHGYTAGDVRGLLLGQPWGWALIYATLVGVLGLAWTAQRLGPPLPVPDTLARRGAADYVAALAGLFGRAGRTDWVADHYRTGFRRALAAPYGLAADAPPAAFAAAYAAAHARPVDTAALADLLTALDAAATPAANGRPTLTDPALLRLIRQAESWRTAAQGA
jgi:hypothetical protein